MTPMLHEDLMLVTVRLAVDRSRNLVPRPSCRLCQPHHDVNGVKLQGELSSSDGTANSRGDT